MIKVLDNLNQPQREKSDGHQVLTAVDSYNMYSNLPNQTINNQQHHSLNTLQQNTVLHHCTLQSLHRVTVTAFSCMTSEFVDCEGAPILQRKHYTEKP